MEKNVKISILCQIYGKLLTKKQFEIITDYYDNDLSLSEIAENNQITREEIVSKTGLSDRTVSRAIKHMQDNSLILREGSKKLGAWKIL